MFFAAERELRGLKRRTLVSAPEGITVDSEMDLSLGSPPRSHNPARKSLDSVYPAFSSTNMNDLIKIADPEFVVTEQMRPFKKQRVNAPPPAHQGDLDIPEPMMSPNSAPMTPARVKFDSLEDLINSFPELRQLIEQQEQKRSDLRVPLEYVRPYEKPKHTEAQMPSVATQPPPTNSVFASLAKGTGSKTMSMSTTTPEATSTPVTPAEPLPGVGGGLLAGIDDLFGDSKRTKLKSKSRR